VPGASHNLKTVEDDREAGFSGEIVPGVVDRFGGWVAAKLAN
jgi:hypothetical protein